MSCPRHSGLVGICSTECPPPQRSLPRDSLPAAHGASWHPKARPQALPPVLPLCGAGSPRGSVLDILVSSHPRWPDLEQVPKEQGDQQMTWSPDTAHAGRAPPSPGPLAPSLSPRSRQRSVPRARLMIQEQPPGRHLLTPRAGVTVYREQSHTPDDVLHRRPIDGLPGGWPLSPPFAEEEADAQRWA